MRRFFAVGENVMKDKKKWQKYGGGIAISLLSSFVVRNIIYCIKDLEKPKQVCILEKSKSNPPFLVPDKSYENHMKRIVEPYVRKFEQYGTFQPEKGISIHYRKYITPNPLGHVVVSHGFCENTEKYREVIYYFLKEGYSVYIMDHRDHGYSVRTEDDLSKVYIKKFSSYVSDFNQFMVQVVLPSTAGAPCYLYAHSMGGGIGTAILEEHPEYFDKAVLSCPMLEPNTGLTKPVAKLICNAMSAVGRSKSYVPGHKAFNKEKEFEQASAGSEERFNYYFHKCQEDKYMENSGATYGWLRACLYGTDEILRKRNLKKITTPCIVFQAEKDKKVKPYGIIHFTNKVKNSKLIYVPNAKHELYSASNEIQAPYFNMIFSFLGG